MSFTAKGRQPRSSRLQTLGFWKVLSCKLLPCPGVGDTEGQGFGRVRPEVTVLSSTRASAAWLAVSVCCL